MFGAAGAAIVQATEPGHIRSAARRVAGDGRELPALRRRSAPAEDTTAPTAAFSSALADGKVFSRRKAPRELSGSVSADPSGLRSVRLAILRKRSGKCWTYRDTTERFKRASLRRQVRTSASAIAPTGATCCPAGCRPGATPSA